MMRNVVVKICYAEQQFENAALLLEVVRGGTFGERRESEMRVGEQPIESRAVNGFAALAPLESEIGAREGLVEKMIEAQAFGSQRLRNFPSTLVNAAASGSSRRHDAPFGLAGRSNKAEATVSHIFAGAAFVCREIPLY